jgi:hypothetical protein
MYLDEKPVNTWLWFRYNRRDGWADVDIRIRDVVGVHPSAQELSARKLVKALEKSLTAESPASIPAYDPLDDIELATAGAGIVSTEVDCKWETRRTNIDRSLMIEPNSGSPESSRSWLQKLLIKHLHQK